MSNTMKKWKFFMSLFKERDWLEQMAAQGWLFTNLTFGGMRYHFKKIEPCEKVFEVERFAISPRPSVQELNARNLAMDVTSQAGWEVVTHVEDMTYYFVKDKAGDETDEFYDDKELRRERAERYRKFYSYEMPIELLITLLAESALYIVLFLLMRDTPAVQIGFMWFFFICTILIITCILFSIISGQYLYHDLCLSREEWANRQKHSVKKQFKKVQQLRSFLQEQSEFGLSFVGYENGAYLFEEDTVRYNYFVDTKSCLKKRLKKQGTPFAEDKKDWYGRGLKWYEMSLADAAQYGLQPVAVIKKSLLIYKRPYSLENLPWENGNENLSGWFHPSRIDVITSLAALGIGILVGFFGSMIIDFIK